MERNAPIANPLTPFLQSQGVMILDGGLATELEAKGCDISDELWSAGVLMNQPALIRQVHTDYLQAGADCITSASYQATVEGFTRRGLGEEDAVELLVRSVVLAREARDSFWNDVDNRTGRLTPLVAASIGPYGAYLADGSEFTGDYGLSMDDLRAFHQRRWQILTTAGADLLACETLPSRPEALALRGLLEETPGGRAWFSFSCRDGERISDGTPLEVMVGELEDCQQIVAVGVNCTAPTFMEDLIGACRRVTGKPIVVYPNSGEAWDAVNKSWIEAGGGDERLPNWAESWMRAGARLLGGCCRTCPPDIRDLRQLLTS